MFHVKPTAHHAGRLPGGLVAIALALVALMLIVLTGISAQAGPRQPNPGTINARAAALTTAGPTSVKVIEVSDQAVVPDQAWWDQAWELGYRVAVVPLDTKALASPCKAWTGSQDAMLKATNAHMLLIGTVNHPKCATVGLNGTGNWKWAQQMVTLSQAVDGAVTQAQVQTVKNAGLMAAVTGKKASWNSGTITGAQLIESDPVLTFDPANFTADYTSPAAHAFGGWSATVNNAKYRIGVQQSAAVTLNGVPVNVYSMDPNALDPVPAGTTYTPPTSPTATPTATPTETPSSPATTPADPTPTATPTQTATPTPTPTQTVTPTPTPTPTQTQTPPPASNYPLHTNIVSTSFWVGEIFNGSIADGSQVCSTYDSQWAFRHTGRQLGGATDNTDCNGAKVGGCDGVPTGTTASTFKCATQTRTAANNYFPTGPNAQYPLQNPFYLDLPYDDLNDNTAFGERCSVVPWAAATNAALGNKCADGNFSYMKNRWVQITGPNGNTCYGQVEDAGPSSGSAYHDKNYVFGSNNARPLNKQFSGDPSQGAGMDVSPALNGCLGFSSLDGDSDHVSWRFVDDANVPAGPWKIVVTTAQVLN